MNLLLLLMVFTGCQNNKNKDGSKDAKVEKKITISDSLKWSERMALSEMKRYPESWQIDDVEKPQWDYVHGLVLTAFEKLYKETGDKKYYG